MLEFAMMEAKETREPTKVIFRAVTLPLPAGYVLALQWTDMGYAWRTGQWISLVLLGFTVSLYKYQ
jgi:hypothetical protein